MPNFETKYFGNVEFEDASVVVFPVGLPGFEECRRFLALHFKESAPLVYLQCLEREELCFVTLPVQSIEPEYQLHVCDDDLRSVGLEAGRQPAIGSEVLGLAVVSIRENGVTANLLAPVIVNLENRRAVQAVAPESTYSHQHALLAGETVAC